MSKPLLVTGAAGFVGARFVESCKGNVIAVDDREYFSERPEHKGLDFGKIVDRKELLEFLESKPQIKGIVHLGACTDTTEMNKDLLRERNLLSSQMLWKFAAEAKIPFVYASSAATYGDGSLGYEDDESKLLTLRPLNPYGESKHEFDRWVISQERGARPKSWAGLKFFNVYGFGERHKGRMASVALHAFDQIKETGRLKLFKSYREEIADGEQRRDFISVEDVVKVLWFALERPLHRGIFNLGTGRARSFLDLAHAVFLVLERPVKIDFIDMPPGLASRYQYFTQSNVAKLRQSGYREPFLTLEEGIRKYADRLL